MSAAFIYVLLARGEYNEVEPLVKSCGHLPTYVQAFSVFLHPLLHLTNQVCVRHQWVLYNVKGCSCVTVLYVFLHGSTSAVVQIRASSLTQGHCLLVEADRDPRQLQSLRRVSLSLQRSVRDHNIHITRVYANNGDI